MLLPSFLCRRPAGPLFTAALGLCLGLAGTVRAATLTVTTVADSGPGSLRDAADTSVYDGDGDVITFDPTVFATRRTILLSGTIVTNTSVTIQGPPAGVVLDGSQVPASQNQLGLIIGTDTGTSAISHLIFQNNAGGGLQNRFGTLTMTDCVVQNNTAQSGGGMLNDGHLTALRCTFANNTAFAGVGGALLSYGPITMTGCTLSGNTASSPGGGIYNGNGGVHLTLTDCTLVGNTAGEDGGGAISNVDGTLTVTNCTFRGNQATTNDDVYGGGGAIAILRGTTTLTNSIFSGDTAPGGGGDEIFFNQGGTSNTLTISHCDIAQSTIYRPGGGVVVFTDGGGNFSAAPRLGPLGDNGGPTQTMALLPGSPCIDTGTAAGAPAVDQRGAGRVGPTDIGAFEYQRVSSSAFGHTHLLWTNTRGQASVWTLAQDGSHTLSPTYGPFSGWSAKALTAAPDTTQHLLWTNTNGAASLWTLAQDGSYTLSPTYGPYPGWSAVSLSTGSDGQSRLLWTNTSGAASLWSIAPSGSYTISPTFGPFPGWSAKLVASGASTTDLLWTQAGGAASLWTFAADGFHTLSPTYGPYPNWSAAALSVGPDDGAHLLWVNTSGQIALWGINFGAGGFTQTDFGPFSGWSGKSVATGPDGVTHVLWNHAPDGQASLWGTTGSSYTHAEYGPFSGWSAVALSAGP